MYLLSTQQGFGGSLRPDHPEWWRIFHLWIWNDNGRRYVVRLGAGSFTLYQGSAVEEFSKTYDHLGMSASPDKLYIFGYRYIIYKRHSDIMVDKVPWSRIPPPGASPETTPMPSNWFYTSLNETEGGQLLATICSPDEPWPNCKWYKWGDGKWERNNFWRAGHTLGAFPLRCHARLKALEATVQSSSVKPGPAAATALRSESHAAGRQSPMR